MKFRTMWLGCALVGLIAGAPAFAHGGGGGGGGGHSSCGHSSGGHSSGGGFHSSCGSSHSSCASLGHSGGFSHSTGCFGFGHSHGFGSSRIGTETGTYEHPTVTGVITPLDQNFSTICHMMRFSKTRCINHHDVWFLSDIDETMKEDDTAVELVPQKKIWWQFWKHVQSYDRLEYQPPEYVQVIPM